MGRARSADTFLMIDRLWYGEAANPAQIYAGEYNIANNTLRNLTLVTNALCSAVSTCRVTVDAIRLVWGLAFLSNSLRGY